jgi:hypothetical protein
MTCFQRSEVFLSTLSMVIMCPSIKLPSAFLSQVLSLPEFENIGGTHLGNLCALPLQKAQETELAAIRGRLIAKFGNEMTEKRLADLLKLAQFKMLSREIRMWRSPTTVLSMRPKRSMTMR